MHYLFQVKRVYDIIPQARVSTVKGIHTITNQIHPRVAILTQEEGAGQISLEREADLCPVDGCKFLLDIQFLFLGIFSV